MNTVLFFWALAKLGAAGLWMRVELAAEQVRRGVAHLRRRRRGT